MDPYTKNMEKVLGHRCNKKKLLRTERSCKGKGKGKGRVKV
jgi:hypothetical protein